MTTAPDYDGSEDRPLLDPTDPTHQREICRNRDEIDFMLAAAAIDKRLPRMLYLRKRKWTLERIAKDSGLSKPRVHQLFRLTKTLPA